MNLCLRLFLIGLLGLVLAGASPRAHAQQAPQGSAAEETIAAIIADLDRVENVMAREDVLPATLDRLRRELDTSQVRLNQLVAELRPRLEALQAQILRLGERPAEGEPAEPETIAAERASLAERIRQIDASIRGAQALGLRASQLQERMQSRRRALFTQSLFERSQTPLSLSLWREAIADTQIGHLRLSLMLNEWWRNIEVSSTPWLILLGAGLGALLLYVAGWAGVRHFRHWDREEPPEFWQRAASGAWVILMRIIPTLAWVGGLYFALWSAGLLPDGIAALAWAVTLALITISAVSAVSTTILAPHRPVWRIFQVSDRVARQVNTLMVLIAFVYGIDLVLGKLNDVLFTPLPVTIAQTSVLSIVFAGLLAAVVYVLGSEKRGDHATDLFWLGLVRFIIYAIALVIVIAVMIGYVAFARFLAAQVLVTGTILIVAYLLLVWVNAVGDRLRDPQGLMRGLPMFEANGARREQIALFITLVLKASIFLVAFPLILLQWGFDRQDLADWASKAFFGFEIGSVNISIVTILGAMLVFLTVFVVAKVLQSWLDSQVLQPSGLSSGLRDSIRTGLGYTGFIVAGLIAVSYAGVDFSNIAIVAGALSVGIGFGLQSIVNNFVSGLILLAERPIKVGDWIIVGDEQGYVRKISVRATEIETFDRSNVIVPNSLLISEKVKNWTLHNNIGRVIIPVGVSYNSDPEQVKQILLDVARQNPQVLSFPEPFVYFEDFADSSLNFQLYAFVLNITQSFSVRTALRIAILKTFREQGIEIPFPQRDVHLRDLDGLKQALARQMERVRAEQEHSQRDITPKPTDDGTHK
jgi:potassium efflux system protein